MDVGNLHDIENGGHVKKNLSREYLRCYEQIARDDLLRPFEPQPWRRQIPILRKIGDTRGKIVVDVGAGKGWTISHLKGTKIALDLALPYLKNCKFGDSHPVEAAAEYIPLGRCADIVICDSVLEHVLDPNRVVKEMRRILKEEGRIFISVPYREDLSAYLEMSSTYPYTHLRSFDLDTIKHLLLGFTIEEVCMAHLKRYPLPIRFLLRQLKLRLWPMYKVIRQSGTRVYIVLLIDFLFCRFSESYYVLIKARIRGT